MVEKFNFINIREILSRLTRVPTLRDITLEEVIQYTLDFIGKIGVPKLYNEKVVNIEIENYRAMLPCDLVQVIQVKDKKNNYCLRYNTDSFMNDTPNVQDYSDSTYKVQGRIIYTSFKEGIIELAYKSIAVDEDGLPLIPDTPKFLTALEWYIRVYKLELKLEESTDYGQLRIMQTVLTNAQQEYAFAVAQCTNSFIIPSIDEMQSITGLWNQLIVDYNEHHRGFKSLGAKEYIKAH